MTRQSTTGLPGRGGFTLAEVLFVMIIVGVLTTMMAPMISPARWRADRAAQDLSLSLNAAQRLAVLRQHDVVVTFLLGQQAFQLLQDLNNSGVADDGEELRLVQLPETMGFGQGAATALPQGAGPVTFATGSGDPTLTFHRNGSASSSGAVYLRAVEGADASSAMSVRALTVVRATGEIRCYSYRSGAWEDSC